MSTKNLKGKNIKYLLYSTAESDSGTPTNKLKYHLSLYRLSPAVSELPAPDFSTDKKSLEVREELAAPNASSLPLPNFSNN